MNSRKLFRVAKIKSNDEDKHIIVCGHSRACGIEFDTEDEAWEYINEMGLDWDIIVTVVAEMFEIFNNKNLKK
jgi:hypothetical protein